MTSRSEILELQRINKMNNEFSQNEKIFYSTFGESGKNDIAVANDTGRFILGVYRGTNYLADDRDKFVHRFQKIQF